MLWLDMATDSCDGSHLGHGPTIRASPAAGRSLPAAR